MTTTGLSRPLPSLAAWTDHFDQAEIPVLAASAELLEQLRANEDEVDAHLIGSSFASDPLMTLKVLRAAAALGRERRNNDAETITAAVVLMGITPFFRDFGPQPVLESWLDAPSLSGAEAVLRRSGRAARFAIGFAAHRLDPDAPLLHDAALLHDFAEILLWCHAPALAAEIAHRQAADAQLRSHQVQREVLGIELSDLQQALMKRWHLPASLARVADDKGQPNAQELCVLYATRLARHTAQGWDNAALPDDIADVSRLLNLGTEPTRRLLHELVDEPLARESGDSQSFASSP